MPEAHVTAPRFRRIVRYGVPICVALVLCVLPTLFAGTPVPNAHDEFGYLLSADTFASGRLTNPTPEHWQHFETIHQLQTPSYQSKYPPAQGLVLALGQWLWHPILGVWLGVAAMIAALVWMLDGLVPRYWSLVGGMIAALQFVVVGNAYANSQFGYWSQSYWGGAMAAGAGALVLGSLPRLLTPQRFVSARRSVRTVRFLAGVAFAVGGIVLANTRPKEGLIVIIPVLAILAWTALRTPQGRRRRTIFFAALPTVVLGGTALWLMKSYNFAVTGSPWTLPWKLHYEQYCVFPLLVWQEARSGVEWSCVKLAAWYGGQELEFAERHHSVAGFAVATVNKLGRTWIFFLGPVLTLPFACVLWANSRPWHRLAMLLVGLMVLNHLVSFAAFPHYSAPVTGAFLLLTIGGVRVLCAHRKWRRQRSRILMVLFAVLTVQAAYGVFAAVADIQHNRRHRTAVAEDLEASPGRDLVFVRYGPASSAEDEYVFNRADLDSADIVWARERTDRENSLLRASMPDRRVWRLEVGYRGKPRRIVPLDD